MLVVEPILDWTAQNPGLAVTLLTVLAGGGGASKSLKSGYLKNVREGVQDLPEIHETVREIPEMRRTMNRVDEDQQEIKNGLIALAEAHEGEDTQVDVDEFRTSFSDNHSSDYTAERS